MSIDDDKRALLWNAPPPPARVARPGELLFEFIRASDRAPMACELRFNGESYGWEAQFLERAELLCAHGGFVTRAQAVEWAHSPVAGMLKFLANDQPDLSPHMPPLTE